jgi:hypothetical protein
MEHFVIRVDGPLPDDALVGFEGLSVAPQAMETVLHGDLPDQAALAGILDRLNELAVTIVEVVRVPPADPESQAPPDENPRG